MPTITGTIKDSLGTAADCIVRTQLSAVAVFEDQLVVPEGGKLVTAGAVSIAPPANAQLVPAGTSYTVRVQGRDGLQRVIAGGVTVTVAMDTLDDIL